MIALPYPLSTPSAHTDFQVDNAVITLTAKPVPTTAGAGITLQLSGASLSANIQATGGCSPLGVDICDWVLGTDRILQRAIEDAINAVVGQASIQNVLAVGVLGARSFCTQ